MKRILQNQFALAIVIAMGAIGVIAQQPQATPPAAATQPSVKVEGRITTGLDVWTWGMPSFTLKTEEGKEYVVHLGPMRNQEGNVFVPKVGETVTVTAMAGHQMGGQNMIHATEIIAGRQTFRLPAGSLPGPMGPAMMGPYYGQGPMGPAMMGPYYQPGPMGRGMMGQYYQPGPMGRGMMGQYYQQGTGWCPGMTWPW